MAKKNYNLLIGVGALVGVVLLIALVGYLVSRARPKRRNIAFPAWFPAM